MSVATRPEESRKQGQLRQDLDVRTRARELVAHQRDIERPGRPLFPIFAGAVLSLLSFGAAVLVAHQTWYAERISDDAAYLWLSAIFIAHAAGVLIFAYAYESYNPAKAIRLALVLLLAAVGIVAVIAVVFAILAASRDSDVDLGGITGSAGKILGNLADLGDIDIDLGGLGGGGTTDAQPDNPLDPTAAALAQQRAEAQTRAMDSGIPPSF